MTKKRKPKPEAPQNSAPVDLPAVVVPRSEDGKLLPGAKLNPGGRTKQERDVVEAARGHGVAIIERLAEMFFHDGNVYAGIEVLNRGFGKASQKVVLVGDDDGGPVKVQAVREILVERFAKLIAADNSK